MFVLYLRKYKKCIFWTVLKYHYIIYEGLAQIYQKREWSYSTVNTKMISRINEHKPGFLIIVYILTNDSLQLKTISNCRFHSSQTGISQSTNED